MGHRPSDNRGVPQLEDDECGWDAAGLLETLYDRANESIVNMNGGKGSVCFPKDVFSLC